MGNDAIFFIAPDGRQIKLTLTDLQPHHKALVVAAVRRGSMTIVDACRRYSLSTDRYLCWHRRYAATTADG